MQFWWVSQNKTYRDEREGGYLWAPKRNENGQTFFHWQNVAKVKPGDIIFSYFKQHLVSVSTASSEGFDAPIPSGWEDKHPWHADGWRVNVDYEDLEKPLYIMEFKDEFEKLLPDKYSPMASKGGAQGYLFYVPEAAAEFVLGLADWVDVEGGNSSDDALGGEGDDKWTPAKVRVGQALFKKRQKDFWKGKCAVTGVETQSLLRASHTVPWSESSPEEKVDVFNGFLLSPVYDAAFDAYLISFDDNGTIIISPTLSKNDVIALGLNPTDQLRKIHPKHIPYLKLHRTKLRK